MKQFSSVVLGGTFDRIHCGHEALLTKAFEVGDHVTIGLTSDLYVKKFKILNTIQPFVKRKKQLHLWLKAHGFADRTTIVAIDDAYGLTTQKLKTQNSKLKTENIKNDFEAIVVSSETRSKAEEINTIRKHQGLKEMAIVEVPMVRAQDGLPVSVTRIKLDQIDTSGKLILPAILRGELSRPIARVLNDLEAARAIKDDTGKMIVTVGDKTTQRFITEKRLPEFAIIDLQVERKPYVWQKEEFEQLMSGRLVRTIKSGPGFISHDAVESIRLWAEDPKATTLLIDGEEDLLVLPVILYSPLGTILYYGQPASRRLRLASRGGPKKGLVRVVVNEKAKHHAQHLLSEFT